MEKEQGQSAPVLGSEITVKVTKLTVGGDGKLYVTIFHEQAENKPTLIWRK